MDGEADTFFAGLLLGIALSVITSSGFMQAESDIVRGKRFIMDESTYKCVETNKLEVEK